MALEVVNTRLLSHPVNWVILWITLALAAMAYHAVHRSMVPQESIAPD